eukprot:scaffold5_cov169-Amphora_coffeaeformis.AAC.23
MGNQPSIEHHGPGSDLDKKSKYKSFPGSAILEKTFCGSIDTTDPSEYEDINFANRLLKKADIMCISSPEDRRLDSFYDEDFVEDSPKKERPVHPSSAMLARALVSEVTNNPKTMKPSEMAAREKQLLKAQQAASKRKGDSASRPVGAPGGVGPPNVLSSLAFAVTGDETAHNVCVHPTQRDTNSMMAPGPLQENRAAQEAMDDSLIDETRSPYAVTIGLSLSRRHTSVGHPDTVTRQTAFDFNELQDRQYKYVSSTDKFGWRAGGGEPGGPVKVTESDADATGVVLQSPLAAEPPQVKVSTPDLVHIPIIQIDCQNQEQVDQVVAALASGEIFIPHMAILPEALSVNGISPPDLVVRFGCERNEDTPADEWPNWCLEFVHNQLYEYFYSVGARWMKRPFSITLARKVKWKTVKHMNRYFSHAERVIEGWRERGPQYLDPQPSYIEGGATPEEVANPHGIYLMRNGKATNYFSPNFDPPYTTKMTRSLLENVLGKSWDRKRREWASEPIPKLVTPNLLLAMACGCTDPGTEGFLAREVTSASIRKTAVAQSPIIQQAIADIEKRSQPLIKADPSGDDRQRDEEKKTDDMAMDSPDIVEKKNKPRRRPEDAAPSEFNMSTTTVMHENSKKAAQRILTEDWGSDKKSSEQYAKNFEAFKSASNTDEAMDASAEPPGAAPQKWTKKKKSDPKEALEQERNLSDQLLNKVKSADPPVSKKGKSGYVMSPASPLKKTDMQQSGSGISMEYSHDGSSTFINDGTSTLLGQQFEADGSVLTVNTKEDRYSKGPSRRVDPADDNEDEASGMISTQEGSVSTYSSIVPSDEELLAIGWAKAMDPSSGNYYYFTLDRSKIVWDSPLTTSASEGPVDP